ncbi:MAG: hypothetical protein LAT82_04405 [Nanoarchaeota archaeon]|nr:hypothetical protein [Nanoarchaeota archaeon]
MNIYLRCVGIFLVILSLFSISYSHEVTFYSPSYFPISDNEIDSIRILEDERIVFEICIPEGQVSSISGRIRSTNQNINIDIQEHKNGENCYYANIESLNSDSSTLEIEYTLDSRYYKFSRDIKRTKKSEVAEILLNQDFSRINDAVELSYILMAYREINGDDEISEELYSQIRDLRDNDRKCWPNRNCNIVDTSIILYNLKKTGYNENRRLLQDGLIYVNSNILNLSLSNAQLVIEFKPNNNNSVSCNLFTDDSSTAVVFNFNTSINTSSRTFNEKFNLECNFNVDEILFKINEPNRDNLNFSIRNSNNFEYSRERVLCYGGSNCDILSTLYIMNTYDEDLTHYKGLIDYIETYRSSIDSTREFIFSRTNSIYSALYLNVIGEDEKIENYLKFSQNNDGSWGDDRREDRRIFETAISQNAMNKISNSNEYVENSKEWIYFSEPNNGWGNIERNSLAFMSIRDYLKPFLIIQDFPLSISADTTQEINIQNPSTFDIFNVRVEVEPSIRDYISFSRDIGSIRSKESLKGNFTSKNNILADKKGYITITGIAQGNTQREEFIKLPIIIRAAQFVSIEQNEAFFSPLNPIITVEIINDQPQTALNCEIRNSFTTNRQNLVLDKNVNILSIQNRDQKTGELEINLICRLNENVIEIDETILVKVIEPTFDVELSGSEPIEIDNFDNINLIIRGLGNSEQTIEITFKDLFLGLVEINEPTFTLIPSDRRFVRFDSSNSLEVLENLEGMGGVLEIKSSSGYIKEVEFVYNHNLEVPLLTYILIGIGIFLILIFALIIYRIIEMKLHNSTNNQNNQNQEEEDELIDLDGLDFK